MKNTLARIALLALPALFAVGCGGDDLFGTLDGGSSGTCPANTVVHRITDGPYNTLSATIISDTCNVPALMPADVMSTRNIMNDTTTGTINVTSGSGAILGSGPVRCNAGSLTADQYITKDPCKYHSVRTSTMTVNSDSTFTLDFSDAQSDFMSTTGACTMTTACTVHFTVQMQHQ